MKLQLPDELATEDLGRRLALATHSPCIIYLTGELGAGKTCVVRGFLRALGHTGRVKSPTYTLVEPYHLADKEIYHFDLYRLNAPEEFQALGWRDLLSSHSIFLIEWPERANKLLPAADLLVELHYVGDQRLAILQPFTPLGREILAHLVSP